MTLTHFERDSVSNGVTTRVETGSTRPKPDKLKPNKVNDVTTILCSYCRSLDYLAQYKHHRVFFLHKTKHYLHITAISSNFYTWETNERMFNIDDNVFPRTPDILWDTYMVHTCDACRY